MKYFFMEWLYIRSALRALKVSYSDVGEGWVAVFLPGCSELWKNTIFPELPVQGDQIKFCFSAVVFKVLNNARVQSLLLAGQPLAAKRW